MDRLLRHCLCWFLLVPALASAATRTIIVEPSDLVKTYAPGQAPHAFSDSRNWNIVADVPAGKARPKVPVTKTNGYGWGAFRGGLKNALKVNPASLAINGTLMGLLAGIDWIMTEGVLSKNTSGPVSYTPTGSDYYWSQDTFSTKFVSPDSACEDQLQYAQTVHAGWNPHTKVLVKNSDTNYTCRIKYWDGTAEYSVRSYNRYGSTCPTGSSYSSTFAACVSTTSSPVTDVDLDDFTNGINSPQVAADIAPDLVPLQPDFFANPDSVSLDGPSTMTGESSSVVSTDPVTGTTTVTETTPSYDFDFSTNPLTVTTTYNETKNTYQNGILINTETTNNTSVPVETQSEIPTDCEFMPTVCAFLEWYKAPAPPPADLDMPMIDEDFQKTYSGPSLSETCPAPFTVATGFAGNLSIPVDALCDLAGLIKYLVLSAAGLLAAFIISGTRRA